MSDKVKLLQAKVNTAVMTKLHRAAEMMTEECNGKPSIAYMVSTILNSLEPADMAALSRADFEYRQAQRDVHGKV